MIAGFADSARRQLRDRLWLADDRRMLGLLRAALRSASTRSAPLRSAGLMRQKTFTLTAVTTLALALGPATAVFSLVNGVLLDPLPGATISIASSLRWTRESRTQSPRVPVERTELPRSSRAQAGSLGAWRRSSGTSATIGGDVPQQVKARGSPKTCSTCSASAPCARPPVHRRRHAAGRARRRSFSATTSRRRASRRRCGRTDADRRRPTDRDHRRAAARASAFPRATTTSGSR